MHDWSAKLEVAADEYARRGYKAYGRVYAQGMRLRAT